MIYICWFTVLKNGDFPLATFDKTTGPACVTSISSGRWWKGHWEHEKLVKITPRTMGTMDEDMEQKYRGKFDHDRGPLFSWNFLEFSGLKKRESSQNGQRRFRLVKKYYNFYPGYWDHIGSSLVILWLCLYGCDRTGIPLGCSFSEPIRHI